MTAIKFGSIKADLQPSPIEPSWVLEGNPIARIFPLSATSDGLSWTVLWDCTAGRFNWFYGFDESVHILEGSVVIRDEDGVAHNLSAGDTIFFPRGAHAVWTVETYVRKIAFCRNPLPGPIRFANRLYYGLKRALGRGSGAPAALLGSG
jgi:uncharacterized cupin superfamily protein